MTGPKKPVPFMGLHDNRVEESIMSEYQTQDRVDATAPMHEGQPAQAQPAVSVEENSTFDSSATAAVQTQTQQALAEPVHVLPATRADSPAPVQHPVAPPAREESMSFKEFSQMAGAMAFVICFVVLGLHAISVAGY
ncbi:MAG: hypothetical protein ABF739_11130 [Acetobacter okinawensis]|uniref:hypothetical protein n=1 Tax=Acetobacter okinawensis TaxID=1076594 RepID=UPI0039EB323C